jgi:queuosine precursor transporter
LGDFVKLSSRELFVILCAFFVTALVIADIIGSKLFIISPASISFAWVPLLSGVVLTTPRLVLSSGIIPFPLTFVLTDLINEFYGKDGAKFVTLLGLAMAIFAAGLLYIARILPVSPNSPIPQSAVDLVFGMSGRIFLASLTAYLVGQFLDIQVFHFLRSISQEKMLWLRTTGSTVVSQLIDSFIVIHIAFAGKLSFGQMNEVAINNYGVKFLIAIALTPLCYLGHALIKRLLSSSSHQSPTPDAIASLESEESGQLIQ